MSARPIAFLLLVWCFGCTEVHHYPDRTIISYSLAGGLTFLIMGIVSALIPILVWATRNQSHKQLAYFVPILLISIISLGVASSLLHSKAVFYEDRFVRKYGLFGIKQQSIDSKSDVMDFSVEDLDVRTSWLEGNRKETSPHLVIRLDNGSRIEINLGSTYGQSIKREMIEWLAPPENTS